jgi:hypothetical protein
VLLGRAGDGVGLLGRTGDGVGLLGRAGDGVGLLGRAGDGVGRVSVIEVSDAGGGVVPPGEALTTEIVAPVAAATPATAVRVLSAILRRSRR